MFIVPYCVWVFGAMLNLDKWPCALPRADFILYVINIYDLGCGRIIGCRQDNAARTVTRLTYADFAMFDGTAFESYAQCAHKHKLHLFALIICVYFASMHRFTCLAGQLADRIEEVCPSLLPALSYAPL